MTNIKGYIPKKPPLPTLPTLGGSIDAIIKTKDDLETLKKDVVKTIDTKVQEIDTHIENSETILDQKIKDVDQTIEEAKTILNDTIKQVADYVKETSKQGETGKDAEPVDTQQIVKEVLLQIPKVEIPQLDENSLLKKFLAKVPTNKASLKVIQESFEIDPMSVIDKILSLPEGKFKLKTTHIDGLEQTISAFRNQITSRGYLHGGGDTVVAGTNITLVKNANGTTTINASSGSTSPLTTKGDLYTYTTTNARLPIGTNGQILSADSTQTTGLKWIPQSSLSLTVGTTPIFSGADNNVLFQNGGVLQEDSNFSWASSNLRLASAIPTWFTPTAQSGGSLTANTTYYYKIVAHTIDGTTLPSVETSALTTNTNKTIQINWALFPGATSYDIYRSTTSGVYGATSFLENITAFDAYFNWLQFSDDAPYGRNTVNDNGSISLSSGTPPTVNSAYLNKVGALNHMGGTVFYQAPLSVLGVTTMIDSGSGFPVPLTSPIQIDPNDELSDGKDHPIFTVGKDTGNFVGGSTLGMWWESADIGPGQFHLRNPENNYNANFKAGNTIVDTLTVLNGDVSAQYFNATLPGAHNNLAIQINNGVSGAGGFYDNSTIFPESWGWAFNNDVWLRFGANYFSLPGGVINGDTADYGANRLNRFNVFSVANALQTGTIVNDGAGNTTGTGTLFTTEFGIGDTISVGSTEGIITAITDDTHLTTTPALSNTFSGAPTKKQAIVGMGSPTVPQAFYIGYDGRMGFGGLNDPSAQYIFNDSGNRGTVFGGKVQISAGLSLNGYFKDNAGGAGSSGNVLTSTGSVTSWKTPLAAALSSIVGNDRKTALTASQALATYTVGASDATFQVSANVLITTSTLHSFSVTCSYTDESNTARVLTLNFSQLTGAFVTTLTNALGASAYEGVPVHIRAKAGTTIIIASTGTFTTVTYNLEERILAL